MSDPDRLDWLRRCNALFGLALLAATWKLWTPFTDFPQIPVVGLLVIAPAASDWLGLSFLVVGLLGVLILRGRGATVSAGIVLLAGSGMIMLNQHRLQPWMYLLLILTSLAITPSAARIRLRWMRAIIISIYVYSAISKLDYQFLHTTGLELLDALLSWVGLETESWPSRFTLGAVILLPVFELGVSGLLLFSSTRRAGIWVAAGLHVTLILVLGPLGLHHHSGVLVWNAYFLVHNGLLFGKFGNVAWEPTDPPKVRGWGINRTDGWSTIIGGLALLIPLGQWVNVGDHWTAWEVYAPRTSRARLVLRETNGDWNPVSLDRLQTRCSGLGGDRVEDALVVSPAVGSLSTLGVPGYPQARFELACLIAIDEQLGPVPGIMRQYQIRSVANRWTGQRRFDQLNDLDAVRRWTSRYRLNTRARLLFRLPAVDGFRPETRRLGDSQTL